MYKHKYNFINFHFNNFIKSQAGIKGSFEIFSTALSMAKINLFGLFVHKKSDRTKRRVAWDFCTKIRKNKQKVNKIDKTKTKNNFISKEKRS